MIPGQTDWLNGWKEKSKIDCQMKRIQNIRITSTLFVLAASALLLMGLTAIYSTTYAASNNSFLFKQLMWIMLGLLAGGCIALLPPETVAKYSKYVFLLVLLPLAYLSFASQSIALIHKVTGIGEKSLSAFFPLVVYSKGAARWLRLGGFTLQPAEFGKFAIILVLSTYYGMRDTIKIESLREGFLIPGLAAAVLLALIFLGKSFSNTLITATTVLVIMFVAGVRLKYIIPTLLIVCMLGCCGIGFSSYRRQRIINFIYKDTNEENATTGKKKADNHQLKRAICAIGSGGMTGLGLGKGRLKNQYIPESNTDFIFAVIGEEFGFLGVMFGVSMYMLLMLMSFMTAMQCRDRRGVLTAIAVGFIIPFQAMYNLCVVCGIMPTTGVTAPLVSYGGSSIISMMLCIGLVLNVCRCNYADAAKPSDGTEQ